MLKTVLVASRPRTPKGPCALQRWCWSWKMEDKKLDSLLRSWVWQRDTQKRDLKVKSCSHLETLSKKENEEPKRTYYRDDAFPPFMPEAKNLVMRQHEHCHRVTTNIFIPIYSSNKESKNRSNVRFVTLTNYKIVYWDFFGQFVNTVSKSHWSKDIPKSGLVHSVCSKGGKYSERAEFQVAYAIG